VSDERAQDTSPRASGPAGPQFEVKVGTHFALALLAESEAFGLPGAVVEALEFQRAGQGHPLDDIIVKGKRTDGSERCLEVQAKRSMSFTEADTDFAAVAVGIAKGHRIDPERRFAVAIERTTGAIDNGVQEALELARNTPDASAYFKLLNTKGRSNESMRRFVSAFRKHLEDSGVVGDDALFDILNRFVVLVFDYARPESIADHHDRNRAKSILGSADATHPYDTLLGLIFRSDAIGGQTNRAHLVAQLSELGLPTKQAPRLVKARSRIEEMSRFALAEISTDVAGHQILRGERREALAHGIAEARSGHRIVEITGPGGAGKSALLRWAADAWGASCRVMVFSPSRVPQGGWPALRSAFDIDATAEVFLADLVCDGGGLVCIDGLDRFRNEGEQKTVSDILRSALATKGACILFTARDGWEEEATWLPSDILEALKPRKTLRVEALNDEEASDLAGLAPNLARLLAPDHPARSLARNPFILKRLIRSRLDASKPISEAALVKDWWTSGGHGLAHAIGVQHARRRVLLTVSRSILAGDSLADVSGEDPEAVATLLSDGVIVEVGATDRVKFKHDLFADWALGCALAEDMGSLGLDAPPPFWLSRGFELSSSLLAEREDPAEWANRVRTLMQEGVQSGWAGLAVLALIRSENAAELLDRHSVALLEEQGAIAAVLIRRTIAAHGTPLEQVLGGVLPPGTQIPQGLIVPDVRRCMPLVAWCAVRFDTLPSLALAAAVDLFEAWLMLMTFGERAISSILLDRFADLLVAHLEDRELRSSYGPGEKLPVIRYPLGSDGVEATRLQLSLHATHVPNAASRYLDAISKSPRAEDELASVLEFPGSLASAAPQSFALALRRAVQIERDYAKKHARRGHIEPRFGRLEHPFVLGKAGSGVFADLLDKDSDAGIAVIRDLVAYIEEGHTDEHAYDLMLSGQKKRVTSPFSYGWSRGQSPSTILAKALSALEHWAHAQVESGRPIGEIVGKLASGDSISGAFLLIIVDVVLSHSNLDGPELVDLTSSPDTLALDTHRAQVDYVERATGRSLSMGLGENRLQKDREITASLSQRTSRTVPLHGALSQMTMCQNAEAIAEVQTRLRQAIDRLGTWTDDVVNSTSPQFMASHALLLSNKDNYIHTSETGSDGVTRSGWQFKMPENQNRWLESQSAKTTAETMSFNRALATRMSMNGEKEEARASVADALAVLAETASASPGESKELHDPTDPWVARVGAAAYIARFGDVAVLEAHRAEVEACFDKALGPEIKARQNYRYDVMYDPVALAISGRLYLATRGNDPQIDTLFDAIQRFPQSAAAAFTCHPNAAAALGEAMLASCIRVGLQSCIFPRRKDYDESDEVFEQRRIGSEEQRASRVAAELDWLAGKRTEPGWPSPPPRRQRKQPDEALVPDESGKPRRRRATPDVPDFYFDNHTAEVWLRLVSATTTLAPGKVADLIRENQEWLLDVNGPPESDEDDRDFEKAWTRGILTCAARCAKTWTADEREQLIFDMLKGFSDQAFIAAAAAFLVQSDLRHVEGAADDTAYLVELRQRLWPRLKETLRWKQHLWSSSKTRMEYNLKEIVAGFFLKQSRGFEGATSYTKGLSEAQLTPFLPLLTEISVAAGACSTITLFFLDILEIVPPSAADGALLAAATAWEKDTQGSFWSSFSIGARVGRLASQFTLKPQDTESWVRIADAIASAGVAEGEQLKRKLHNG